MGLHQTLKVMGGSQHLDPADGLALFGRIVIDEADHFVFITGIGADFLIQQMPGCPGSNDQRIDIFFPVATISLGHQRGQAL